MKIEFREAVTTGSYSTLTDEGAGGTLETFRPRWAQQNQATPLASSGAAGSQFTQFKANTLVSMVMVFHNTYADRASALAACRTVPASLQKTVHLKVSDGAETQYYPFAVFDSIEPDMVGQGVSFSCQFRSRSCTATAP